MNNIISLAARVVRKPQPAQYHTVENRPSRQQAYEMDILEQERIWMLASDESIEFKETFLRQRRAFMEPRV